MLSRLIPLAAAALLASCAHLTEREPAPVPELRALVVGHPFGRVADADQHVAAAHAGNFNTIVFHGRAFPQFDADDQGAPAIARQAHALGMDFGLRVEWRVGESESWGRAIDRLVAHIERMTDGESLEWLGVGQPVRQDPISIETVYARLHEAFPGTLLYSGGTPALDLAEAGLLDTRVEHVVPPLHLMQIPALRGEMTPGFPQVVRIGLWPHDRRQLSGRSAQRYIAQRIETTRQHPYLGVALHWMGSFQTKDAIAAMAEGPFAVPAVPPQRDWRWSLRRAVEMAADAPDCPDLIADGVESLRDALAEGSANDMQIHQVLDYLIEINEAHGAPATMAHRHLEFARICLRQSQRHQ